MRNTRINGNWDIMLPDHRADRPEWYTEEGWERKRLDSMRQKLDSRDTIFYVGAEEGDMAGLLAKWGVKVCLFEPNDRVWPNIKAIWEANKLPNPIVCFPGFASDTNVNPEELIYDGFPDSADGPLISDHGFKELADPSDIPQIRLDDIKVTPTALSIDVEGSEWLVLKGAERILKVVKPKIWLSIHPEFMYHHFQQNSGDLRKWITDFGYTETLLEYRHELHVLYEPINVSE